MENTPLPANNDQPEQLSKNASSPARRPVLSPTNYLMALATLLALSIAYYFAIALPSHERGKLALEREEFQAQQDKEALALAEKNMAKVQEELNSANLDACIEKADESYWEYMKLNGAKEVPNKPGVFTAPRWVWDEAEKEKKAALEECYKKYK